MNYWHYVEKVISNLAGQVNMSELMKEMQEYIDRYPVTEDERLALLEWVQSGHSVYERCPSRYLPESEEQGLIEDIKGGVIDNIQQVLDRFADIHNSYSDYRWAWSYQMILDYYQLEALDAAACERIHQDYVKARRAWIAEIRKDAEKEYSMGDVEKEVFDEFLEKLDHEIDYEN